MVPRPQRDPDVQHEGCIQPHRGRGQQLCGGRDRGTQLPGFIHRRETGGDPGRRAVEPVLPGDPHHQGNEGGNEWREAKILRLGECPGRLQFKQRRRL